MMHRISNGQRAAVTLVEVLFAIGVVMIGLLGLLSVMPLAGRRAQDAVSLSVGAEMADSITKDVLIRKWLGNGDLLDMEGTPNVIEYDFAANRLQTVGGTLLRGICIDPLYCAVQSGSGTTFNGYDNRVFPYYIADHDPLLNPADADTTWDPPGTFPWPAGTAGPAPRLRRVGLRQSGTVTPISAELARTIIESANDLIVSQPNDTTLPARLTGLNSGETEYGKRIPSGEYSWFATLTPSQNERFASLSIVVLRNRVVDIDFPTAALTPPIIPEMNGMSERVAMVTYASGFSGGAGGTVRLTSSITTSSDVVPNDWIMLSRRVSATEEVHRWYRVVAIHKDPEELYAYSNTELENGGAALPAPNTSYSWTDTDRRGEKLWRRQIMLDGPDWEFGYTSDGYADSNFFDNTFATMVQGVVSVSEQLIPWTDL
ncbi:type IV pilus modification PilV family protein [Rhodopirellula halodulae]|uniref:type IV pilus modification PilV family protein n=1 Tax=Rhodopirellula halodulae TaxID=2894198 RepID=UPI001E32C20E|nr:hypothetical protein [Rhodopirellula sp. JC737]MCC9655859.1 hypothetical protein [Rhodopirellula sp. JC737]